VTIAPAGLKYTTDDRLAELVGRRRICLYAVLAGLEFGPFEPDHRLGEIRGPILFVRRSAQATGLKAFDVYAFRAKVLARVLLRVGNEGIKGDETPAAAPIAPVTRPNKRTQCQQGEYQAHPEDS
jgi:hypothetical protein